MLVGAIKEEEEGVNVDVLVEVESGVFVVVG